MSAGEEAKRLGISRRAFLRGASVAAGAAVIGAGCADMGLKSSASVIVPERVRVAVPGLPSAFEGYRVGFYTDIHLGIWVPDEWVASGLDMLRAHSPDLLVLGGDYVLCNDNPLWPMLGWVRNPTYAGLDAEDAAPQLFAGAAKILSSYVPPDGIVAVVGNHERWNDLGLFSEAFRRYPAIRVLLNEQVVIRRGEHSIAVFGSDDFLTGLPQLPSPLEHDRQARLVVSHNPDYVSAILARGVPFALALCGHTHGGQVCLPGVSEVAAPVNDKRFVAGMAEVGGSLVYTSRGLGVVGIPFRVNCPPEITIFELVAA